MAACWIRVISISRANWTTSRKTPRPPRNWYSFRLRWQDVGTVDIVLFLAILYHVKHPILALENVCGMTRDMACIESFVSDPDLNALPVMEYYETTELRRQLDNWVGPNAACLM